MGGWECITGVGSRAEEGRGAAKEGREWEREGAGRQIITYIAVLIQVVLGIAQDNRAAQVKTVSSA